MSRLVVFTLLAVLPAGGVAQRGDWPMPAKDYAATRYSSLSEITGANAGRLRPVWSFSTGVLGGHEGQPLVVDNTMYVVTPYPNVLYAFDLTREGYPLKWKYRPPVDPNALGIACCDAINRGAFYADGKIVYNLLDGHTVAVAAATGKELWKTRIADLSQGETTPVAPLVVKHRVIVGASGGEFGIHGWLKGLARQAAVGGENVAIVPAERGLHAKLLAGASLDRWVEAWEKVAHLLSRSDAVNLDRKQTVLVSFFALQSAMR